MKATSYIIGALAVAISAVYASETYCLNNGCASEPVDCTALGDQYVGISFIDHWKPEADNADRVLNETPNRTAQTVTNAAPDFKFRILWNHVMRMS
ncbi:unnamed protein product [Penicillium bialowiezense]